MAAAVGEDPADAELRENRFSYLLQPIRDLAANWDIDIAAELEEYLEELEGITFAIEDCGPSLNFAEAALLIQGTTCVYSKKVEYLHNLVFRALETIHSKKQKERTAAEEGGAKRGARQAVNDDLDEAFLALDEVALGQLAGEGEIDLDEDEDDAGAPELLRPPTALLALEDAAAGQGECDAGCYRLAQCAVHESGALLLELRDGEAYDRQLRSRMRPPGAMAVAVAAAAAAYGSNGQQQDGVAGDVVGFSFGIGGDGGAGGGYDDYGDGGGWDGGSDGGDEGGGGIDMDDGLGAPVAIGEVAGAVGGLDAAMGGVEGLAELPKDGEAASERDAGDQGMEGMGAEGDASAGVALRQRRGNAADGVARREDGGEVFDPYKPLDPNNKGALLIKPLQVRKPRSRAARTAAQPAKTPAAGASQLSNPEEFGYLAAALAQARKVIAAAAARQRRAPRRAAGAAALAGLVPQPRGRAVLDWSDVVEAEREDAAALMTATGDAAGGADLAGGLGGAGDDDWGGDDGWAGGDGDSDGGDFAPDGSAGGPGALQAALEEAAGAGRGWLQGTADGSGDAEGDESRLSYEELCRAHIEKLIAAAAAQQIQSDLQVRVATWRQRIDPVLSAEEDRSAFDIHDYGGAILERLGGKNNEVEQQEARDGEAVLFQRVVACDNRFEVARMFAAMLQLVNNRNVELCKSNAQNPSQPFSLQLLCTDRHHEIMGERIGATGNANAVGTQLGRTEPAGASQQEDDGQGRKAAKGRGRNGAKAAAKAGGEKGRKGDEDESGGQEDDGWDEEDSISGSDEENQGRRRRKQGGMNKGGKEAAAAGKKPQAKRPRKAKAQAAA